LRRLEQPSLDDYTISDQMALRKAFTRYMMGQFGLYVKFWYMDETRQHAQRLAQYINDVLPDLTLEKIDIAREFFADYIDKLQRKNLISLDDACTFKEIYPLFEPMYVFYDEDKEFYQDLADVAKDILG
jgi:hypothetical protein